MATKIFILISFCFVSFAHAGTHGDVEVRGTVIQFDSNDSEGWVEMTQQTGYVIMVPKAAVEIKGKKAKAKIPREDFFPQREPTGYNSRGTFIDFR